MGVDLRDLVFRLERRFGLRILRTAAGSSRLYDSLFDSPAVVKKNRRAAQSKTLGAAMTTVRVLAGCPSNLGAPSPRGRLFLSPRRARPITTYDSCPIHR